jgi:hypothetical protein
MLGRRSTLIGAMVAATNTAVHNAIERKNPTLNLNKVAHAANKQLAEHVDSKEVILTTEGSKTLQTSSPIE